MYEEARREPGFFFARIFPARMKMIDPLRKTAANRCSGENACARRAEA